MFFTIYFKYFSIWVGQYKSFVIFFYFTELLDSLIEVVACFLPFSFFILIDWKNLIPIVGFIERPLWPLKKILLKGKSYDYFAYKIILVFIAFFIWELIRIWVK